MQKTVLKGKIKATRMHSSRMRTPSTVTMGGVLHPRGGSPSWGVSIRGGFSIQGGSPLGGSPSGGVSIQWGGVPCDLSHLAFDVTCMLSPHQLRLTNSAAAYIVVVQDMMGYPPPLLTESQTPVKT